MAKVQTRRSISVNRQVYEEIRRHCNAKKLSMSAFIESCVARVLPTARPTFPEKKTPSANPVNRRADDKNPTNDPRRIADKIFTF